MPPTKVASPAFTVNQLLTDNWAPANTSDLTPNISTGWYDRSTNAREFRVTVTPGGEFEFDVGLTPNGPAAIWDGAVDINVWVSKDVPKADGSGALGAPLARKLAYEGRQEVDRIVRENQLLVADLLVLRPTSRRWLPDNDESPVVFRWLVECAYNWIEEPA